MSLAPRSSARYSRRMTDTNEQAAAAPQPEAVAQPVAPVEHIAQFFEHAHLPEHLAAVSKPFGELAAFVLTLPRNPERTVALRKLLEAKDAAVRALVAK